MASTDNNVETSSNNHEQNERNEGLYVQSVVEDIIDRNISNIDTNQNYGYGTAPNVSKYNDMNVSQESLMTDSTAGLRQQDGMVSDSEIVRQGRSLMNEMSLGEDETFDPNDENYMPSESEDAMSVEENSIDSYEQQQAAQNIADGINSEAKLTGKQKGIMIAITVLLIIIGGDIIRVMINNFTTNMQSIGESDVIEEAFNQIRGNENQADTEIGGYIDQLLELNEGEDIQPEESEQLTVSGSYIYEGTSEMITDSEINDEQTLELESNKIAEEASETTTTDITVGDFRYNFNADAVQQKLLDTIRGLVFSDGVYEPIYDNDYYLDTKNHKLNISGSEIVLGELQSDVKYVDDPITGKVIVCLPDNTLWKIDYPSQSEKTNAKDCGFASVYCYTSRVLGEVVAVEFAGVDKAYTTDDLKGTQ